MKQLRPQAAQMRSASARDSFPRTDLENLEITYRNCSLLVRLVASDSGKWAASFQAGTPRHNDESSLPFAPAALRDALDHRVLCQHDFPRPGSRLVRPRC